LVLSEHHYCRYCGYGYFADPDLDPHCGRSACRRRFESMDFPCYDQAGNEWCMYPERHLPREYGHEARRTRHPQKLLI
jgi:hypothetical protein